MKIVKRIKDIATAEIHALLDQAEDPIKMLNHYVREMEEEIARGQQAYANQLYLEKRQMAFIADADLSVMKRTRQAKLAVDQGEEAIAKLALQEKLLQEKKLNLYLDQYETIKNQTALLLDKLNELKEKYNELQNRRLLLISRANVAQSIKQMNQSFASFNSGDNIAHSFARAEERIIRMEAEAEAGSQLYQASKDVSPYLVDSALQEEVQLELDKLKQTKQETA
ncbi:PspA/IM30 family protein [Aneurinibacillus sp. Ricciae_BoGa-3]|uniref:PspA/IM30 family protein n=1 Tax=Aneurinibacillus sp. Ricciae_BoGa-3 TaxID=3022697 RepID=UPI00233FD82D|nr:PspA/IM30 family protein [Aneurinibacillus sp. Ricciae_BoGa-3]WCK54021.1 PspA/IM30 family protein [Aneurinibacillus sp. Ricciae_BoGa-3]